MADGEHLSEQTRRLWTRDTKGPLEGTEKHPQGRLFAPVGSFTGDPWKLAPENWLKQGATPAHKDIITWHGSEDETLPRTDEYEHRANDPSDFEGADWNNSYYDDEGEENPDYRDWTVDDKERPMTNYGSAVGLHFGSLAAASERSPRPFIHPARIPEATMTPPPRGSFSTERPGGSIVSGKYLSEHTIENAETGERTPDTRWSDNAANYAEKGTDLVEHGKTLAYRNDVEAKGSTSYRALPETVRTWSEDVMNAKRPGGGGVATKYGWHDDPHAFRNTPHPALVHLAEKGYDPVIEPFKPGRGRGFESMTEPLQLSLPFGQPQSAIQRLGRDQTYEQAARWTENEDKIQVDDQRRAAFDAGHTYHLRRP